MKRLPHTPLGQIRNCLRRLWLRSRERATALKSAQYTCEQCGKKQSKVKGKETKINVHHKNEIDWDGLLELIRERLLHDPTGLEVLCVDCHDKKHKEVTK